MMNTISSWLAEHWLSFLVGLGIGQYLSWKWLRPWAGRFFLQPPPAPNKVETCPKHYYTKVASEGPCPKCGCEVLDFKAGEK